jgi:hypothetical protein
VSVQQKTSHDRTSFLYGRNVPLYLDGFYVDKRKREDTPPTVFSPGMALVKECVRIQIREVIQLFEFIGE